MTFQLPLALADEDDTTALRLLKTYFGSPFGGPGAYGGASFDLWDSLGTKDQDVDRFTADDLIAVSFLSVDIAGPAAERLLRSQADHFNELLSSVGPDKDLVDAPEVLNDDWSGWTLNRALLTLPEVGATRASKLFARKRPRLRPIWDAVVAEVTNSQKNLAGPLHLALVSGDRALHHRLVRLRELAELPEQISALRVFDVVCWMEGKARGLASAGSPTG